jgi:putative ATP-dependent endonuclease of the OLD family
MKIRKIKIKNFRLLEKVDLLLEDRTTVIVGRNNSGKTSLTELFRRFLTESSPSFSLEDFSLGVHEQFWAAYNLKKNGKDEAEIRESLPVIEVKLTLSYDKDTALGPLSDFIIDLNPDCTEALLDIRYQLEEGKIEPFFEGIELDPSVQESEQRTAFFRAIKERISKLYKSSLLAVDPNDPSNQKPLEWQKLRALLQGGFINAQRGLDDITHRENDVLGKILEALFKTAQSNSADPSDRSTAQELKTAVQDIQGEIDKNFGEQLRSLFPALAMFGYPGLVDPNLCTETSLDVEKLLNNHTKIRYSGINGIRLPEAYNGLGVRNLIFILLKLYEFFKLYKAMPSAPGVHLVFIEEPEVHLHPQMQEVFISKLSEIAGVFAKKYNGGQIWPVQFIVSTHSSHMANKAPFDAMRYFHATAKKGMDNVFETIIKDLKNGFAETSKKDKQFLHEYMTLTRCDLLFADKAIFIEGTTERLLMPRMIEKVDEGRVDDQKLASQYVSVVEVGGAYAHIFFNLLNFLELKTLIITDLDAVNHNDSGKACKVSDGTRTSNACIKSWFGDTEISPGSLIKKTEQEKIYGIRRLAYQIPEADGKPCGRSFEDAFILTNSELFGLAENNEEDAWNMAKSVKKSEFALKYAIEKTNWIVPRYIQEGLIWLAENPKSQITSPGQEVAND